MERWGGRRVENLGGGGAAAILELLRALYRGFAHPRLAWVA